MGRVVGRRGVGVCAIGHRAVPVSRLAGLCGKVRVTARCVRLAEPQLLGSHPPQYTHLQGLGGRGWPSAGLPHLRRDFPGLAAEAGVGSCKGVWQPLDLALVRCVTFNRCLLDTEPPAASVK